MSRGRYLAGWVTAEVSGAEPERFLTALAQRDIPFWNAAPPKDYVLTVCLPYRMGKLVPGLAKGLGCEGRVRSRHGLPALCRRLRRRYGLMACLLLGALLLFAGSTFVWQIDVEGNVTVPEGPIRQALQECGVDIGAFWPAFSQDAIRNGVILRVPAIRWMTVDIRGGHAHVIVREKREHLPVVQMREYVKIVSTKPALVDEVQALHGTAETEPGRAVLPGETLIGGYTTGRFGVLGPGRAVGRVTGRTWYELTARAPLTEQSEAPAGRERGQWALILGKTRINFYKGSSICPAGCDKIIESHPLAVKGLFTLPIALERTVTVPVRRQDVPAEGLEERLEGLLTERLLAAIGPEGMVTESHFTSTEGDGTLYVTLRAECREPIGAEIPLTDADLAEIQAKIPPKTEDQGT